MDISELKLAAQCGHMGAIETLIQRLETAETLLACPLLAAQHAIELAAQQGTVITVEQVATTPFRMGAYRTVVSARAVVHRG